MKNYLEVYLGSRGLLEGIEVCGFEDIEKWLEEESESNKELIEDEDERSEWEWDKLGDEVYYLGLGEEEVKYYIDMEGERYKEWERGLGRDWKERNELENEEVVELLNLYDL